MFVPILENDHFRLKADKTHRLFAPEKGSGSGRIAAR
jgi:hypothetical protein